MKAKNYKALHYVLITSILITYLYYVQIIFCLRPFRQITYWPSQYTAANEGFIRPITAWKVGFPGNAKCR